MEWIPQYMYFLRFKCCPVFPLNDIWEATSQQLFCSCQLGCEAGRPTRAVEQTNSSRQSMAKKRKQDFLACYQSTYAEGDGGVWWVGSRWAEVSDGIFPSITLLLLSACVNKASLKCLIILCKLQDQRTYERLPISVCVGLYVWIWFTSLNILRYAFTYSYSILWRGSIYSDDV